MEEKKYFPIVLDNDTFQILLFLKKDMGLKSCQEVVKRLANLAMIAVLEVNTYGKE